MWTVYVIRSAEGLTYIGMTSNLQRRLKEHNSKESRWTKRGNNWTLFYSESHLSAKEA
ncbi:MAG: GIY-YIG nuclease family protein [Candidatus Marinimicrobia bacterium]|nr:GIY-YIG nuclease family protein [Candidatus Neomarinimicrobiota bacterium]